MFAVCIPKMPRFHTVTPIDSSRMGHTPPADDESPILSYLQLRRSIGVLGLALPVILGPIGKLCGIPLQENMSSYYHTGLRDVFVGIMCSFGVFLYCYSGQGIERLLGRLGAFSAIGIALFPMSQPGVKDWVVASIELIHILCGGLFFLTLAYFSLFIFPGGEPLWELPPRRKVRHAIYYMSGLVILGCLTAMGTQMFLLPVSWSEWLGYFGFSFWMEWIAVWAFASAWLVKGEAILGDKSRWILFDNLFQKLVPAMSAEDQERAFGPAD